MPKIAVAIWMMAVALMMISAEADEEPLSSTTLRSEKTSEESEGSDSTITTSTTKAQLSLGDPEVDGNILESEDVPSRPTEPRTENAAEETRSTDPPVDKIWECPNITKAGVDCSCDFPHTIRCTGDRTALQVISEHLKNSREGTISLLDVTVTGISTLPARFLEDIALHGLVVSTGELRRVNERAFTALARPLQALGLPNNLLDSVPNPALAHLVGLDRLDLSHNRLKTLEARSFEGLTNLTYLDLCDNLLSQLSPKAFEPLGNLRSLRMRGNRLSVSALSALRGLGNLEELDLSSNLLLGPLGPNLLPPMERLRFLTLADNELVNVQRGALAGLPNLTYLSLSHNQIDVLEDHSFERLSSLTRLDLANNRIVAVSSLSLAHLENLTSLDLTHNVLRSLTADLVVPLLSLLELRLDDNDITMVASDVPTSKLRLKRLSLADNPLNCDCTLLDFANWLTNSELDAEDKSSAVCATPPALENGVLTQVSPGSLLCGEPTPSILTRVPLAGAQLTLRRFSYDDNNSRVDLEWRVEPCTERYTCDTLIIYETTGETEVEIESSPLQCDSSLMRDPCSLSVTLPTGTRLKRGHGYRYCAVLMLPSLYDEYSLGLGCSDVIPLEDKKEREDSRERSSSSSLQAGFPLGGSEGVAPKEKTKEEDNRQPALEDEEKLVDSREDTRSSFSKSAKAGFALGESEGVESENRDRITGVSVDLSERGFLHVDVSLAGLARAPQCEISVAVFEGASTIHREKLNCSLSFVTMSGLTPGSYRVCASLDEPPLQNRRLEDRDLERSRCVEVEAAHRYTEIIVVAAALLGCAILVGCALLGRNLARRLRPPRIQTRCFMPAEEFEITHKAHYIKLWATTKV